MYGGSPTYKGDKFKLHSPAEHSIDGTTYDMEISIEMTQNTAITTLPKAVLSFLFSVENPTAFFCTEKCI